jgi:hypothetical protein
MSTTICTYSGICNFYNFLKAVALSSCLSFPSTGVSPWLIGDKFNLCMTDYFAQSLLRDEVRSHQVDLLGISGGPSPFYVEDSFDRSPDGDPDDE